VLTGPVQHDIRVPSGRTLEAVHDAETGIFGVMRACTWFTITTNARRSY
jgi:hypothetical protein